MRPFDLRSHRHRIHPGDLVQEQAALEASYAHPEQFEKDKVFPGTSWEIMKPTWRDYLGFFGTWALVGLVIVLLWLVVTIR